MFPLPQEGLDSISVTRHVSVISITLSTVPLDARSPGYQPPLPPGMVKTHLSPVPHMGPGVGDECVPPSSSSTSPSSNRASSALSADADRVPLGNLARPASCIIPQGAVLPGRRQLPSMILTLIC